MNERLMDGSDSLQQQNSRLLNDNDALRARVQRLSRELAAILQDLVQCQDTRDACQREDGRLVERVRELEAQPQPPHRCTICLQWIQPARPCTCCHCEQARRNGVGVHAERVETSPGLYDGPLPANAYACEACRKWTYDLRNLVGHKCGGAR